MKKRRRTEMNKSLLVLALIAPVFCVGSALAGSREDAFLKALQAELHRRGDPWVAGKTPVSHLPLREKSKLCGIPLTSKALRYSEFTEAPRKPGLVAPDSMDWRNYDGHNWMTSVKSQGKCGGCWAFAWVAAQEARMKIYRDHPNEDYDLSEQFVVSCNPQGHGCNGGMGDIGNWVQQDGIPDEDCFPYEAEDLPCGDRCSDWGQSVVGIGGKVVDWGQTMTSTSVMKTHCMNGPTYYAVDWPEKNGSQGGIREDFFYYKGGVYEPVMGEWIKSGHAICLCGWNASDAWLIKNSWGSWGDRGYGYINHSKLAHSWMTPEDLAAVRIRVDDIVKSESTWDPGEQTDIIVTLESLGLDATDVQVTISTVDPHATVDVGSSSFGNMASASIVDNSSNPFQATASVSALVGHAVAFDLQITANGGYSRDFSFELPIVFKACGALDSFDLPTFPGDTCITYGLAYDGTNLYMTEFYSPYIYKFDKNGTFLNTMPSPENEIHTTGIDYDAGNNCLWVTNSGTKMIYKVNPSDGSVLSSFSSPATAYATGLAFDGTDLWAVDRDDNTIYRIATDGAILSDFTIPIVSWGGPRGLAFDPTAESVHGEGTLILFITHWNEALESLDSCVLHEIKRDGTLIQEHRCVTPGNYGANGRMVCVDPDNGEYWVDGGQWGPVYKVAGFHWIGAGVEDRTDRIQDVRCRMDVCPNPFTHKTVIQFVVRSSEFVDEKRLALRIHDLSGRVIRNLQITKSPNQQMNEVVWDGKDDSGRKVASGVYFCKIESPEFKSTRKLTLLR
jgi:hypothetical protein